MTKINFINKLFFGLLFICLVTSCKTTEQKVKPKAFLVEHPERFFWEIKNETNSVFILGTIHAADNTFYPIEENILKHFDSAEVLVSEIGGKEVFDQLIPLTTQYMLKSFSLDAKKHLSNFLSEDDISFLYEKLGENDVKTLMSFDPWVLNFLINQAIIQEAGLQTEQGFDLYLMVRAGDKKIRSLESPESQMNILIYGNFETQLEVLKASIKSFKDIKKIIQPLKLIKKFYLNNDKTRLEELLHELMEIPEGLDQKTQNYFTDMLLKNRNEKWVKQIIEFLESGKKTFVFAGTAHFLGKDSVFELMKKMGYLVDIEDKVLLKESK